MNDLMPFLERRTTGKDGQARLACSKCDLIVYENPKIVVGSVIADKEAVLLCQRRIQPSAELWTVPAGYLELGETLEEGARREAWEEAQVEIETDGVLALYSSTKKAEVEIFFRARPTSPHHAPGAETLATRLFAWDEIPWSFLAFPSVGALLKVWHQRRHQPLPSSFAVGD